MELKLDDATRASLLGLMPMTQTGTVEFTPPIFAGLPDAVRPVFIQRALTRSEKSQVMLEEDTVNKDAAAFSKDGKINLTDENRGAWFDFVREKNAARVEWARKTVTGWKSVVSPTGNVVDFKAAEDKGADPDLFDGFLVEAQLEIYNNAKKVSSLLSQERLGLKSLPESK
jgi:hypothetical protein